MNLGIRILEGAWVVRVAEPRLVFAGLDLFMEQLGPRVNGENPVLVLDMEEVNYLDSAAIGCIMDLYRQAAAGKGFFGLAALRPRVATMLRMTGAHEMIGFFDSVEDALRGSRESLGEGR